jgi:DNA-binding NtrC family response regulator
VLLAEAFIAQFCRQHAKPLQALSPESIEFLHHHPWPGNVRQLENLLHRAVFLCDGPVLDLCDAASAAPCAAETRREALTGRGFREAKAVAIARFERAYIAELLARTRGNITLASQLCGKERSRLTKLVKKHGLDRGDFAADITPA